MKKLVKSRWNFLTPTNNYVTSFLDALGVSYRKGINFWEQNKFILPEIYEELKVEVRSRMRDSHPDHGGDEESFKELLSAWRRVQRQFSHYLPPEPVTSNVKIIPTGIADRREKKRIRHRAYKKANREKVNEQRRVYYHKHKSEPDYMRKDRERVNRWRKSHPETLANMRRKYQNSPKGQAAVARRRMKRIEARKLILAYKEAA